MYLGWHFLSETKHLEIVSISRQDGSRIIRITIFKKLHNCNDHDINILLISILTHSVAVKFLLLTFVDFFISIELVRTTGLKIRAIIDVQVTSTFQSNTITFNFY